MTDDEIRGWLSDGPSRGIHINSKTLNAICTAALDARAKLAAQSDFAATVAEKICWVCHYSGSCDDHPDTPKGGA
jgi:hypothetical protein